MPAATDHSDEDDDTSSGSEDAHEFIVSFRSFVMTLTLIAWPRYPIPRVLMDITPRACRWIPCKRRPMTVCTVS